MNEILSTIGSCSIIVLITYITKISNEYRYLKRDENKSYKIDKEDDEYL